MVGGNPKPEVRVVMFHFLAGIGSPAMLAGEMEQVVVSQSVVSAILDLP